jgi:hypothetical protein
MKSEVDSSLLILSSFMFWLPNNNSINIRSRDVLLLESSEDLSGSFILCRKSSTFAGYPEGID